MSLSNIYHIYNITSGIATIIPGMRRHGHMTGVKEVFIFVFKITSLPENKVAPYTRVQEN